MPAPGQAGPLPMEQGARGEVIRKSTLSALGLRRMGQRNSRRETAPPGSDHRPSSPPPRGHGAPPLPALTPLMMAFASEAPPASLAPQDVTTASSSAVPSSSSAQHGSTPPSLDEKHLVDTLRERGVSTAFFAAHWRKYSDAQSHSCISEADARRFLGDVAEKLDLRLELDTYTHIIETCKSVGTCITHWSQQFRAYVCTVNVHDYCPLSQRLLTEHSFCRRSLPS